MIFNLYTQFRYGNDRVHVDYDAVRDSMQAMKDYLQMFFYQYEAAKIGIPKIGCGLAGGDWEVVSQIIEEVFDDKDIYVYILDGKEVKRAREAGSRIEKAIQEVKNDT